MDASKVADILSSSLSTILGGKTPLTFDDIGLSSNQKCIFVAALYTPEVYIVLEF